jgi:hypothetical protein
LPPAEQPKPTSSLSKITFSINTEATVTIDTGAVRAEKRGKSVEFELEPGSYNYQVTADGYLSESGTFELTSTSNIDKEIILKRTKQEPKKGQEKLKSPKEVIGTEAKSSKVTFSINTEAAVLIDDHGNITSKKGNHVEFELKPGDYTYAIAAYGYISQSGNFYLESFHDIDKEITLTRATPVTETVLQPARPKKPRIIINSTWVEQNDFSHTIVHINMDGWDVDGETLLVVVHFGALNKELNPPEWRGADWCQETVYPTSGEQHWEDFKLSILDINWRMLGQHELHGIRFTDSSVDMNYRVVVERWSQAETQSYTITESDFISFKWKIK